MQEASSQTWTPRAWSGGGGGGGRGGGGRRSGGGEAEGGGRGMLGLAAPRGCEPGSVAPGLEGRY